METFKVRRISQGCCGMKQYDILEAKWDVKGIYIYFKVNGEWSSSHYFSDKLFEVL